MTGNEYQLEANKTAHFPTVYVQAYPTESITIPHNNCNYIYPAIGLSSESGEALEKVKKIIRNQLGVVTGDDRIAISKEIGDVLWYAAALATSLGLNLDDIMEENIKKLQDRKERGVICSEGDNR